MFTVTPKLTSVPLDTLESSLLSSSLVLATSYSTSRTAYPSVFEDESEKSSSELSLHTSIVMTNKKRE